MHLNFKKMRKMGLFEHFCNTSCEMINIQLEPEIQNVLFDETKQEGFVNSFKKSFKEMEETILPMEKGQSLC